MRSSFFGLVALLGLLLGAGCDDEGEPSGRPDGQVPDAHLTDAGREQPSVPVASPDAATSQDAATPQDAGAPLLPWREGNSWTYRVTGDGEVSTKVITVGALEPVGGSGPHRDDSANKTTTKKSETDQTVSWQVADGERVIRYREQSFGAKTGLLQLEEHWAPYKLHVDGTPAHTQLGASWIEEYEETKQTPDGGVPVHATVRDAWTVDAVDQEVTVPAGTFRALVLIKGGGSSQKTYWYVPGVGKVKETGGQTEELVSFKVQP